jgi:hypothetical protein
MIIYDDIHVQILKIQTHKINSPEHRAAEQHIESLGNGPWPMGGVNAE